jgi:hypothetical protein
MDSAFVPSKIVVEHFVSHKFTIEFGPSILSLGKPIRKLFIGAVLLFSVTNIVRSFVQVSSRHRNIK